MLSPPTVRMRIGTGSRVGNAMVQPLPSAVAVIVYVTITVSLGPTMLLPSQRPATSASLMPARCIWAAGAGAGGGFWALAGAATTATATAEKSRMERIVRLLAGKGNAQPEGSSGGERSLFKGERQSR